MTQPAQNLASKMSKIMALNLPPLPRTALSPEMQKYFGICEEKLGMVPNVLLAYAHDEAKLRAFNGLYENLMLSKCGLSKLERELIAVVVSSANHCFYCLTAHGAAVRQYSGDPALGEQMVMNYRSAELTPKQRAMLDFTAKLTESPDRIEETDRQALRDVGFTDVDIWDIAAVAAFFNMTNRLASAVDMRPNPEYHAQHR